jgi:hypothetical protein
MCIRSHSWPLQVNGKGYGELSLGDLLLCALKIAWDVFTLKYYLFLMWDSNLADVLFY